MGQYYSRYYDASGSSVAPTLEAAYTATATDASAIPATIEQPTTIPNSTTEPAVSQPIEIPASASASASASAAKADSASDSDSTPASSANTTPSNSYQQNGQHITKSAKRRAKKLAALQAAAAKAKKV